MHNERELLTAARLRYFPTLTLEFPASSVLVLLLAAGALLSVELLPVFFLGLHVLPEDLPVEVEFPVACACDTKTQFPNPEPETKLRRQDLPSGPPVQVTLEGI